MPMSKIHRFGVCFQNESLDAGGLGTSLIRSTVEADAASQLGVTSGDALWLLPLD